MSRNEVDSEDSDYDSEVEDPDPLVVISNAFTGFSRWLTGASATTTEPPAPQGKASSKSTSAPNLGQASRNQPHPRKESVKKPNRTGSGSGWVGEDTSTSADSSTDDGGRSPAARQQQARLREDSASTRTFGDASLRRSQKTDSFGSDGAAKTSSELMSEAGRSLLRKSTVKPTTKPPSPPQADLSRRATKTKPVAPPPSVDSDDDSDADMEQVAAALSAMESSSEAPSSRGQRSPRITTHREPEPAFRTESAPLTRVGTDSPTLTVTDYDLLHHAHRPSPRKPSNHHDNQHATESFSSIQSEPIPTLSRYNKPPATTVQHAPAVPAGPKTPTSPTSPTSAHSSTSQSSAASAPVETAKAPTIKPIFGAVSPASASPASAPTANRPVSPSRTFDLDNLLNEVSSMAGSDEEGEDDNEFKHAAKFSDDQVMAMFTSNHDNIKTKGLAATIPRAAGRSSPEGGNSQTTAGFFGAMKATKIFKTNSAKLQARKEAEQSSGVSQLPPAVSQLPSAGSGQTQSLTHKLSNHAAGNVSIFAQLGEKLNERNDMMEATNLKTEAMQNSSKEFLDRIKEFNRMNEEKGANKLFSKLGM